MLQGLLEDGEILLTDGRRFVTSKSGLYHLGSDAGDGKESKSTSSSSTAATATAAELNVHRVHPSFRVIALANPPGYPFLVSTSRAQPLLLF